MRNLGARLERPPAERRRLVPEPGDAEERVGAERGLAHLLPEVGVLLLEPHPPACVHRQSETVSEGEGKQMDKPRYRRRRGPEQPPGLREVAQHRVGLLVEPDAAERRGGGGGLPA